MEQTEKKCKACLMVKPLELFRKAKSNKDGKGGTCKACESLRYSRSKRIWERNNRGKRKEINDKKHARGKIFRDLDKAFAAHGLDLVEVIQAKLIEVKNESR